MALHVVDAAQPGGGVVRRLTLDRPERRNALDPDHLALLRAALVDARQSSAVRVVVLTGSAAAFCSGYDLTQRFDAHEPDTLVVETMAAVRACEVPIVAAVEGACFGAGLELAISADLRVACPNARFCLPPAKLGIAYAPQGLARLVGLVGTAQARRLVFTADVLDASEALRIGLVDQLESEPVAAALSLAERIAAQAPLAVRHMKRALNAMELQPSLSMEVERRALFSSNDAREGVAAFTERRRPRFDGS